ncbi:hypothetical protein HanIR_Chr03g0134021 [Helianthus annuus]|nr:hypothetical protein HanIR_Chr03g0134021 [Helianthus annuus]
MNVQELVDSYLDQVDKGKRVVAKLGGGGGEEVTGPKNFYKTGGRKRIYPKISIRKLHTLHY